MRIVKKYKEPAGTLPTGWSVTGDAPEYEWQPWNPQSSPFQNDTITIKQPDPITAEELALRQAYAESNFSSGAKSNRGAVGLFQIMPELLTDYNKKNNKEHTVEDLNDSKINQMIRDWAMHDLYNATFINKPNQDEKVRIAKTLASYNWGRDNVRKTLNELKAKGIDIYTSMDWLDYMPKETKEYVNFILNGENNSLLRNNIAYKAALALNGATADSIKSRNIFKPEVHYQTYGEPTLLYNPQQPQEAPRVSFENDVINIPVKSQRKLPLVLDSAWIEDFVYNNPDYIWM